MIPPCNLCFEIKEAGDFIRIEPLYLINYDSDLDWDKNWIKTSVSIKAGAFSGQFVADLMTTDFELFKRDIKKLDQDFSGKAQFKPLEGQLVLHIQGDGIGHFEVDCTASDQPGCGVTLSFTINFDQTELNRLITELDQITKAFPIRDDRAIKNE